MHVSHRCAMVLLTVLTVSAQAHAQKLVVADFKGKPKVLVDQVTGTLEPALEQQGATVVPLDEYVKVAIEKGHKKGSAFGSAAMRKVAPVLKLDGMVVGRVGKERVRLAVLGPRGGLLLEHVVNHPGELSVELFGEAAAAVIKALGGKPAGTKPEKGEGEAAGAAPDISVGDMKVSLEDPTGEASA